MQHDSPGWSAASVSLTPLSSPPQGLVPAFGSLLQLRPSAGQAVSSGLGEAGPAGRPGLLRLLGDAERVRTSAGRPGGGSGRGGRLAVIDPRAACLLISGATDRFAISLCCQKIRSWAWN